MCMERFGLPVINFVNVLHFAWITERLYIPAAYTSGYLYLLNLCQFA